jgi:hypothetical protein
MEWAKVKELAKSALSTKLFLKNFLPFKKI